MPGGNRMGPTGQGPMTGRAAGYCAGYNAPGYMNPNNIDAPGGVIRGVGRGGIPWGGGRGNAWGGGRGNAWGGGFGRRYDWNPYPGYDPSYQAWQNPPQLTKEDEIDYLKKQADQLSQSLKNIEKRLAELEESA